MSELIRRLNLIKKRRSKHWLTPSQREAFNILREELRIPGTTNLVGRTGVGKTFLAWFLAEQCQLIYVPRLRPGTKWEEKPDAGVLLDNCPSSRTEHRAILNFLHQNNITRAVLVTKQVMPDYTRYVELELTVEDFEHAHRNLVEAGLSIALTAAQSDLWALIYPYPQGV